MRTLDANFNESFDISKIILQLLEQAKLNPELTRDDIQPYLERFGDMEQFLNMFVTQGYLLHGSNNRIANFEPRLPKTVPGKVSVSENEQKAVYAGNESTLPICMAVVSRKAIREESQVRIDNGKSPVSFGVRTNPDSPESQFYANVSLEQFMQNGYVYVLSADDFVASDPDDPDCFQFIAFTDVKPVLSIPIIPEDFTHDIVVIEK